MQKPQPLSKKLSIVIPVYNKQDTIHLILNKVNEVLLSDGITKEVIVVNDGSNDNTKEIGETYCATDNRFHLIEIKNGGLSNARNNGIKQAKGKYISFLDSDDEWYLETIAILWKKIITTDDRIGLVYPGTVYITNKHERKIFPKFRGSVFRDLMTKGTIGGYPIIKKEILI